MSARPEANPGMFKTQNNRAGETHFVDIQQVRGTLKKGFEVSIYTRTKSKAEDVIADGAIWCDTVASCAAGKDAVITIVGFPKDVEEVYFGENGIILCADCALMQDPNPEELAEIGAESAASFEALMGKKAKVAFLCHSTKGSANHPFVDKVVEAVKIAKEKYPDVLLDGELQLDAAIIPEIGASKAPGSPVAGQANVLIFPNLEAGNIGYKLIQRIGKAEAYSFLQGLAAPVNDLSRGCSVDELAGVIVITAVQAQQIAAAK